MKLNAVETFIAQKLAAQVAFAEADAMLEKAFALTLGLPDPTPVIDGLVADGYADRGHIRLSNGPRITTLWLTDAGRAALSAKDEPNGKDEI